MRKLFKKLAGLMMGLLAVAGLAGIGANNDAPVKAEAAGTQKWSMIGTILGTNWDTDHELTYDSEDGRYEITIQLNKGEAFKFRFNKGWTYEIGAGGGNFNTNYFSGTNGGNIIVAKTANYLIWIKDDNVQNYGDKSYGWGAEEVIVETDEKYVVTYYDENNEIYKQVESGTFDSNVEYTFSDLTYSLEKWVDEDGNEVPFTLTGDVSVYPSKVYTWSLCGTISGGNWDNAVPLYYDSATGSYISQKITLNENEEFKIRNLELWSTCFGYAECTGDTAYVSDSSGNAKVKESGDYIIKLNGSAWSIEKYIDVSAQSYTVNYYNDPNGDPIKTVTISENDTAPIDFVYQENYNFLGWYQDADLTKAYSTAPTVTSDLNLYGKYAPCHDYTIYIKSESALNVYIWNNVNSLNDGTWPGTAATLIADGVYAYTVQGEYGFDKVIFNDGTKQTADLTLSASVYEVAADFTYKTSSAAQVVAHIENDVVDLADVVPALGLDAGTHTATATSVGYSVISWNEGTLTLDSQAYAAKEEKQAALEVYMANVDTCNDYVNVDSYNALADGLDTTATVADVDYDWDGTREGDTYVIDSVRAWEADFLVTDDDNAQGHFTVSADFKAQIGYPNTQERLYGFVFYWDEGNWIQVYAKYDTTKSDRMTSVEINGCIGGHDPAHWTNWNTYWMHENWHLHDQGIEADPAKGFNLSVEYNNGVFVPSVDGFVNASYHNGTEWTSVCDLASRFPSDIWTQECKVGYLVLAGENNLVTVSDIDVTSLDGETVDTVHNFYKVKDSGAVVTITEYVDVQVSIQDKLDYMGALALEEANKESSKQNIYANPTTKGKGMAIMAIIGVAALVSIAAYYFLGKKKFAR